LNGVGIDNEMYASHLAPNTVFDPALEQTHIDGNKGLIFSQIASMLTTSNVTYQPTGKVGYVFNPTRMQIDQAPRPKNPGLPAQNDISALVPCQGAVLQDNDAAMPCGGGTFSVDNGTPVFEFQIKGPDEGIWNGGLTVETTKPNALGVSDGNFAGMQLQHFHEGQWHTAASDFNQSFLYLQAGATITTNDPEPGRWRVALARTSAFPLRVDIDFHPVTSEMSPGQAKIDVSSMDFFKELNRYVPKGSKLAKIPVETVATDPAALSTFDSIVVVNDLGARDYLVEQLGLTAEQASAYFANLKGFAEGGGNLVLTDAALRTTEELGLVPGGSVKEVFSNTETTAGNYAFQIANGNITYMNPEKYPLAKDVNLPGAAEQQPGRRQAVEPAPIGYSPDYGMDADPKMPNWTIAKSTWLGACGLADCMTASNTTNGNAVNLGEAKLGAGRVRIAGVLFPDPIYQPDDTNDYRFGLASYALTYTAFEVFENLIDYRRA
ncbi:MAG TPA: hypothetical protein VG602_09585, partial [Actinomycetota bacterium]|nr:hypothetical protein [Actinomycetota bacterium]